MLAAAAVVRDTRVSLRGRACAAGCLKLYMARTPQELVAAGVASNSTTAGAGTGVGPLAGPQGPAPGVAGVGPAPGASQDATAPQGSVQPALVAAATPGASVTLGASGAGLAGSSPGPVLQKKSKPPVGRGRTSSPAEAVTFALGWFADSGENDGEERLWLEEQMLVADGVKEKVAVMSKNTSLLSCFTKGCGAGLCRKLPCQFTVIEHTNNASRGIYPVKTGNVASSLVALPEWLRG